MKFTNETQLESIVESVESELPHGSGINGRWLNDIESDCIKFHNFYEAMNEGGYYCHTVYFTLTIKRTVDSIDFDSWEVETDCKDESTCDCLYDINSYLDDTFVTFFEDVKQYTLAVDLNERGEFSAHVENKLLDSVIVFEYSSDKDGLSFVNDGYMKHPTDSDGLEKWLHEMKIFETSEYISHVRN